MPKVFLAPLLVVGLLILPGCSSAEAKACEAADITRQGFQAEAAKYQEDYLVKKELKSLEAGQAYLSKVIAQSKAAEIILNNPACYTAEEQIEAQFSIEEYKKWFK
jgi:hypothetical protein